MAKKKYYYEIHFPNGEVLDSRDDDEFFDSQDEAQVGAETLHLSNPGDYPDPDAHTEDAEIIICEK